MLTSAFDRGRFNRFRRSVCLVERCPLPKGPSRSEGPPYWEKSINWGQQAVEAGKRNGNLSVCALNGNACQETAAFSKWWVNSDFLIIFFGRRENVPESGGFLLTPRGSIEGKFDTPHQEEKTGRKQFAFIFLFLYSSVCHDGEICLRRFRFYLIIIGKEWRLIFVFIRLLLPHRYHQSHQYQVIMKGQFAQL